MKQVSVPVDMRFSFFHSMDKKIGVLRPISCRLPLFNKMTDYSDIITLSSDNINCKLKEDILGVYIILIWLPWLNLLSPVYVGSGKINNRLISHINYMRKRNTLAENTTPKYLYELLGVIDERYWMVTWSICNNIKYYENEIYHTLKSNPYFINAKAVIKDERSYLQYQKELARKRAQNIREMFDSNSLT